MRPDDVANQGKTQPGALYVVDQGIAATVKLLEDFLLLAGRYADTVVAHFELHAAVGAVQAHANVFLVLGVLQGIVHQVEKRARDGFAVHVYRGNISSDILFEGKTVLFDLEAVRVKRRADEFRQIGFLELIFLAASLDAGEVEDIVDKGCESLTLFADDAEIFL